MSGSANSIWELHRTESIWTPSPGPSNLSDPVPLIALLRVRNEELILEDTLNHIADFADFICAYDDASTDSTREILKSHPKVVLIVQNNHWQSGIENRLLSETRHRGLLMQEARKRFVFNWCMCCDADERYIGPIRQFVSRPDFGDLPDAIRIQLFDAYMTPGDSKPYQKGTPLLNFRGYFGPERRDILMLWKNTHNAEFRGLDSREPHVHGVEGKRFYCQHYGKSLSVEHWEATCDYYVDHFPYEPYGRKWLARKGRAIHSESDFGRPLFRWGEDLFMNAILDF